MKALRLHWVRELRLHDPRAIRLVEAGLVDVRSLVTQRLPLTEFSQAFSVARRREGLKVIIKPQSTKERSI
jgi:L-iditol 2-dehydrogenase